MAKIGSYGWSPRQMERINARRMERGRDPLINVRNIKTEEDYRAAQNLVASSKDNRKPVAMQADKEMSMQEEAQERTRKFKEKFKPAGSMKLEAEERTRKSKEKFKPAGSMAAEYGYKSSFPTPISKGLREAAGKPLIRKSWDEMTA